MIKKLIIFLIRRKLGLRKYKGFQFTNQKNNCIYYFTGDALMRENPNGYVRECHASLNFLLSDDCEIRKVNRSRNLWFYMADEMERDCGDWQNSEDNPELTERIMKAAREKV